MRPRMFFFLKNHLQERKIQMVSLLSWNSPAGPWKYRRNILVQPVGEQTCRDSNKGFFLFRDNVSFALRSRAQGNQKVGNLQNVWEERGEPLLQRTDGQQDTWDLILRWIG